MTNAMSTLVLDMTNAKSNGELLDHPSCIIVLVRFKYLDG